MSLVVVGCHPVVPPQPVTPPAGEPPPSTASPEADGPRELGTPTTRYGHPQFPTDITGWVRVPDSERLAAAYADGTVRVWDPEAEASTPALAVHSPARIQHICASASGMVTAADDDRVRRTTYDGLKTNASLEGPWCQTDADADCGIESLECAPQTDMLSIRADDGTVHLIERIDQPERRRVIKSLADIVLAPDGSTLAIVRDTESGVAFSLLQEPFAPGSTERSLPCALEGGYWPRMVFAPASQSLALAMGESSLPSQICLWSLRGTTPTVRSLALEGRADAAQGSDVDEPVDTVAIRRLAFDSATVLRASLVVGWSGEGFYPVYREVVTWNPRSAKVIARRPPPKKPRVPPIRTEGPVLLVDEAKGPTKSLPRWTEDDARLVAPIALFDVASDGTRVHILRDAVTLMTHEANGALAGSHPIEWAGVGQANAMTISDDGTRSLVGYASVFPEENQECGDLSGPEPGGLLRVDLDRGTRTELAQDVARAYVPLAFLPGEHTALVCNEYYDFAEYFFECGSAYGPGPRGELGWMDLDAESTQVLPVRVDACPTRASLGLGGERVALLRKAADQDPDDLWGDSAYDELPPFDVEVVSLVTGASVYRTPQSLPLVDYALSDDGSRLALSTLEAVELLEADGGALLHRFELDPSVEPTSLALSPDGRLLVIGFEDGSLRSWSEGQARLSSPPRVHSDEILELRFDASGALYSVSEDHSAFRWSVSSPH